MNLTQPEVKDLDGNKQSLFSWGTSIVPIPPPQRTAPLHPTHLSMNPVSFLKGYSVRSQSSKIMEHAMVWIKAWSPVSTMNGIGLWELSGLDYVPQMGPP